MCDNGARVPRSRKDSREYGNDIHMYVVCRYIGVLYIYILVYSYIDRCMYVYECGMSKCSMFGTCNSASTAYVHSYLLYLLSLLARLREFWGCWACYLCRYTWWGPVGSGQRWRYVEDFASDVPEWWITPLLYERGLYIWVVNLLLRPSVPRTKKNKDK